MSEERHVTDAVTSLVDELAYVAIAENCAVDPGAIVDGPEIWSFTGFIEVGPTGLVVLFALWPQRSSAAAAESITACASRERTGRQSLVLVRFMVFSRRYSRQRSPGVSKRVRMCIRRFGIAIDCE